MTMVDETELLVATRRDLHRHPEIGFNEHRTAGIAAERLRAAGYEVRTGIAVTGVVGTLRGGAGDGPTLLLRADMDALPITEETGHDFVSTLPGSMHACGHDAHVAIGLAVAERLARTRDQWRGTVKYMFQPAEEGLGGAVGMIEAGVLDGVDAALGLHVWLGLPSGVVGVVQGPQMAGAIEFGIEVRGRGGHGAMPHETVDALYAASQIVVALQSVVSRTVPPLEPAVVTIAAFHAGAAHNVIAETASLKGTVRAFDPALLHQLPHHVERVIAGVCAALGATYEFRFRIEGPPTVNDPRMAEIVRREAERIVGADRVRTDPDVRTMAAEDFGDVLARVPGCYFFVGGRSEEKGMTHPHHSPRFDLCEDCMPVAVDVLEAAARAYLAGG
ncbi:MAG TPA: amidohydrolase [Longimicrobium sp.]|jgi:amidohydrolase|uniref:M20 metallopeptidase family protein n=1 Tax=Longimicrobium sp. TaxID=2029185 RepID=UPI002EDAD94B